MNCKDINRNMEKEKADYVKAASKYIGTHGGVKKGKIFNAPTSPNKKAQKQLDSRKKAFAASRSGGTEPGSQQCCR